MRVTLPRVQPTSRSGFGSTPQPTPFDPIEENRMRSLLETAFEQIPKSTGGSTPTTPAVPTPDTPPTLPNAMDDEMVTPTTGYNPSIWTAAFNHVAETYALDPLSGLEIGSSADAQVHGIEQGFTDIGSAFTFVTKVCFQAPEGTANSYIGMYFRDTATGKIDWFALGRAGAPVYSSLQFAGASTYNGTNYSGNAGYPQGTPFGWHYLRVSFAATGVLKFEVSQNGVAYWNLGAYTIYASSADRVGLFTYCNANAGPNWVRFFRRTV